MATPQLRVSLERKTQSAIHKALAVILSGDLDFHSQASNYASHSLHAFAAKFPPQLPRLFIEGLTEKGETVLDPMMGSGTTIVEAFLCGRRAIGFDIDPLSLLICRVKTRPVDLLEAAWKGHRLLNTAVKLLQRSSTIDKIIEQRYSAASREFINYWFSRQTQRELMALLLAIEREGHNDELLDFFRVVLSSIIITKSGGVSLAYDLAHSRPHRVEKKPYRDAIKAFEHRLSKAAALLSQLPKNSKSVLVKQHDCRERMPLANESVHLIVTSPPYANAIDYMRAHKFSLVWFGEDIEALSDLRSTYIGSERLFEKDIPLLPSSVRRAISILEAKDARRAKVLERYFADMRAGLEEMYRVLESNRCCIVVVGPSTIRGQVVRTHALLADIAESVGFRTVEIAERRLDRNRRMLPAAFRRNNNSQIENRMHNEFILGFQKPAS